MGKRITIYDVAKELGFTGSYVSRALNDHPAISEKTRELVKRKALEMNYKLNTRAANLRQGSSKTIGVIVPHINQIFFSDAIAGIEEVCNKHKYNLIICQSHESFEQESNAIETLIHQNVDCILISVSAETDSTIYLEEIIENKIQLIQFDRCLDEVRSNKVFNDNKKGAYEAVNLLIEQGYKKIAFLGGPERVVTFRDRKEGYLKAIREAKMNISQNHIVDDCLSLESANKIAMKLLRSNEPPDAFFTVSDYQSLGVVQAAKDLNILIPEDLGIFGFANEIFTKLISPSLSSIDQNSVELGKCAANLYFEYLSKKERSAEYKTKIIRTELIVRDSSVRKSVRKLKSKK